MSIYNETELYEFSVDSTKLGTITRELNPGEWTIDNSYDEQKVIIRSGTTMRVTLKSEHDMGEPGNKVTMVDRKTKDIPEWVKTYVNYGTSEIDNMANYSDRMSFVAMIASSQPVNEIYLQHFVWQQIFSEISEKISNTSNDVNRVITQREMIHNGFSFYSQRVLKISP